MTELYHGRGAPPLYAQIYRALKEDIASGVYGRGDTLPTEGELQARFQVSRITVRQAMQGLEQEGLIRRTRGKGTVVAGHRIEEVLTGGRIMRPAYKSVYSNVLPYTPIDERK